MRSRSTAWLRRGSNFYGERRNEKSYNSDAILIRPPLRPVKHRDSPYGGPAATATFLRQPQESLDFGVLRPLYGRRRVNVTENCGWPTSFEVMTHGRRSAFPAAAVVFMTNIKACARRPQGDRTVNVRRPYGDRAVRLTILTDAVPPYVRRTVTVEASTAWLRCDKFVRRT